MPVTDTVGAFVPHGLVERRSNDDGPLAGLTFALKDLYDLEGVPTGAGSPDWLASHDVPTRTAPAAQRLLEAGAQLAGKAVTDEMAWSITGENFHYGTPINVAAPGRIPGGSSSGSAAATAAGLVDFAIGSDTGGSVRMPASNCGLYGIRPTHGRIPIDGAVPLAPSFDTVGWFAREAELFAKVGGVLLGEGGATAAPSRLIVADDMFARADPAVREALASALDRVTALFETVGHGDLVDEAAASWRTTFVTIQSSEAWATHGAWIRQAKPSFGPGVRERFEAASKLDPADVAAAQAARVEIRKRLEGRVTPGTVVVLPTSPSIALMRGSSGEVVAEFRARALEMLCPAGLAGMPQVTLPLGLVEDCPVGLSLLGPRGSDEALIALAVRIGGR
jgi:amidase